MLSVRGEKELLHNLKQGRHAAFNTIYDLYSKQLYTYLLHKLTDPDLCSDVLQDLFTSLWEKRAAIEIDTSLKAYLYQSARYKIFDVYRNHKKFQKYLTELAGYMDADYSLMGDTLDHRKKLAETMESINKMPGRMKEIFILNKIDQQPIQDIATRLNISKQTVKNQLGKALHALRINYSGLDTLVLVFLALLLKK
ncbi:MAG: sigma-70 family RNA polymerase sigma factor [Mucilaginibacter sp.]|uniref:RNA polymerase sigma factor n=1 Tax=Mucilaginibacter sp. TaxID=1882438 RepID=UPI0031A09136